jgi:CRISPR-associated endonuclease Csn1
MVKNILGLDLGTTSIGFAVVVEGDTPEQSSIKKIGVRVNPLTTDEQTNFEKGKPLSINADRTLKRGARRNRDRYQLRRSNLINVLRSNNIISADTILAEDGNNTTHSTFALRALAVSEKIELCDFAKVLLIINKKRGYKSSRKAKNEEDGQLIDGMEVAKRLYKEKISPGQLAYQLLKSGKKNLPDFYRSDLETEFEKVWEFQKQFYPEMLTNELKLAIQGQGKENTRKRILAISNIYTADNKTKTREEKKVQAYEWRSNAQANQLNKEEVAYVIMEINNDLNKSSGYLGAISDRSKELYFNNQTVGQYLYKQLQKNPHTPLKGQVFYRQDYIDEFETIWKTQSKFHPQLTNALKEELRNIIIFYQRKLKSKKSLISFCEFESREIEIEKNGQKTKRQIGLRVAPRSSPLFQEFKIWQTLHNLEFRNKFTKEKHIPDQEAKQILFDELNIKGNLKTTLALEILGHNPKDWEANYDILEGNHTNKALYDAYLKIAEQEGYDEDLFKLSGSDEINVSIIEKPSSEITNMVADIFKALGINTDILVFNAELAGKAFEQQASYMLWHLFHSYEEDDSPSGNEKLYELLHKKFGFKKEHGQILVNIAFSADYGSLSAKAMRKIYSYIKELSYDKACLQAGYRHSASSISQEELSNRLLESRLELLKKNSLRNPVVEKILNQMVNVVNALIDEENQIRKSKGLSGDFHFDEIHVELARDLKKNAAERAEMTTNINAAKIVHQKIFKLLQSDFGVKNPSRNDIIRYKLYEELKNNGYKDLYTNTYIPKEILFSKQIDIDHIIPQMKVFDDSFSNKTVVFRKDNQDKGNKTAFDHIEEKYGPKAAEEFVERVRQLLELGKKNKEEGITRAKFQKLQKKESEIGDGFIERDLRDSQYIAKKAKNMLFTITRSVISTTGEITSRLREDWDLINVMQEINLPKFRTLGLTEMILKKDGGKKERIIEWSKRNDHRHHAMDALTIAFTKHNHIQYLNYLNARKNENHKMHRNVLSIEAKETEVMIDDLGNKKRKFKLPISNFRALAKEHLENVLVSHKAKNKVVTKNKNKIKTAKGEKVKTELTPRGQLHKETVYGKYCHYVSTKEKIGPKFDENFILMVANPVYRVALLQRLKEYDNDSKKAFGGKNALSKNPIVINGSETLPENVKIIWLEEDYSIRKDITPENFKDVKTIEKVIDGAVKKVLLKRFNQYNGNPKDAFSDLAKNPIWLNEQKGITIKRVKIRGVKNAEPLHFKKDHFGKEIVNKDGKPVPVDYISTGNNHHVAIYRDTEGNLQERVVSLLDAVKLVNARQPVVDKQHNQGLGWRFLFTMKQNEYFVFPNEKTGFNPKEIDLLDAKNNAYISPNLYRVQTISVVQYGNNTIRDFKFRHHLETIVEDNKTLQGITYQQIKSLQPLENIIKVRINHIGQIVKVGE